MNDEKKDQDLQNQTQSNEHPESEAGEEKKEEGGKLYAGKYKTVEELEKGYQELQKKATQDAQRRAHYEKELQQIKDQIQQVRQAKTQADREEQKKKLEAMQRAFIEDLKQNPFMAIAGVASSIVEHKLRSGEYVRREDVEKLTEEQKIVEEISSKEDFEELKPAMNEFFEKLPEEARTVKMLPLAYEVAKAKRGANVDKEALKKQILEEIKAGSSQTDKSASVSEGRSSENEDYIKTILEADKKQSPYAHMVRKLTQ